VISLSIVGNVFAASAAQLKYVIRNKKPRHSLEPGVS
jgi:hypothetical protein